MNQKVTIITALVAVGAMIFVSTKSKEEPQPPFSSSAKFANSDEVVVTANVIIGDLHTEATEALPSDLQPNTEALVLTDEEETELFSILNSLRTDRGVLGALGGGLGASGALGNPIPPLGVSPMTLLTKARSAAKSNIDKLKKSVASLEQKLRKAKGFSVAMYKSRLKKAKSDLGKATNKYKALDAKIKREQAAAEKRKKEEAHRKAAIAKMNRVAKEAIEAAAKKKSEEETRKKAAIANMNLVAKRAREAAEKKRIDAEKAAKLAEKRAREEKERAEKELVESKARAAAQKAKLEQEKAERKRAILEAERHAEAKRKIALEQKRQQEKAAAASAARRRFGEAQAKIKSQALAKKAAELAHRQKMLEEKLAREIAERAEQDKKNKLKAALKLQALQMAEKAAKEGAEKARLQAEKARLLAQEKARERRAVEEEKRRELDRETKLAKMRRDAEEAKRREKDAKKQLARAQAEKDARVKEEREKRAKAQKKVEQVAATLKKRHIELENKDAEEKANAKVVLEHTAADVVAKTALASQKGLREIKAVHRVQQVIAKSKADENAAKLKRIKTGFERITGINSKDIGGALHLTKLDKNVLADLIKFYKDEGVPEDGYVFVSNIVKDKIARENSTDPKVQAFDKIREITGLQRHEFSNRALANLDLDVLQELQEYLQTVPETKPMADELDDMVSFKKLRTVAGELDLKIDDPPALASVDYEKIGNVGLDKLIRVFDSHPKTKKHPAFPKALDKMVDIRQQKNAEEAAPAKGGDKMKSFESVTNAIAESKAKGSEELRKRLERGVERITGFKAAQARNSVHKLDTEVIRQLIKLHQDEGVPKDGYMFLTSLLADKIAQEISADPKIQAWNKIEEMTGLQRHEHSNRALVNLDLGLDVIEELQDYLDTVPGMERMASEMNNLVLYKKLQAVAEEVNLNIDGPRPFVNADYEAIDKVGLDRLIQLLESDPQAKDHPGYSEALVKMVETRDHREALLLEKAEAVEEERLRKQHEEIAALEAIRAAEAQREIEEAAAQLAQEKLRLEQEAAQLARAASAEEERLAAKQQTELVAIKSELEEEKKAVVEQITADVQEVEQELNDELREKLTDAEAAAEQKVEDAREEQAEVQAQQRTEAGEALESIKAEISDAHAQGKGKQEVISILKSNLREEAETRQVEMQETRQAFVAEQNAVVKEAEMVKQELVQQFEVKLGEEKTRAAQKMAESVEQVESQKQELVEMQQEVHELEKQELEIKVSIETEVLMEEARVVEHQQEIVDTIDADEVSSREDQQHPRASKKGRVTVSKTNNADGSSAISMSVPSDLTPGEVDDISILVSKQESETLATYHIVYKKIARDNSLHNLSFEEKEVVASAGAVFQQIREKYVQQRKHKVLRRSQSLASSIRVKMSAT